MHVHWEPLFSLKKKKSQIIKKFNYVLESTYTCISSIPCLPLNVSQDCSQTSLLSAPDWPVICSLLCLVSPSWLYMLIQWNQDYFLSC